MKYKIFNKNYLIAACVGLFILFVVWLLISASNLDDNSANTDKKIEIEDTNLRGYKNGELLWSMQSKYVWSSLSIEHAVIENIYNGCFYDQGKILLDALTARKVQVNAPQERFYADKGFQALMYRHYDQDQPVEVWGEQLNYNAADKRSQLYKHIYVQDRNTKITAERATIEHQDNRIIFGKDTVLSRPDSTLTAEAIEINLNKDIFQAKKNVQIIRQPEETDDEFKSQKTTIHTDLLEADVAQDTASLTMSGNILIEQPDKKASGEQAAFTEKDNLFHLSGNALVIFDKSELLLDQTTRQKFKDKGILQEKLQLQSNSIVINTNNKDLEAAGQVLVTVKNKKATADKANYSRTTEKIYLRNNVYLTQEDGSTVQAEYVVVDIPTEKFTAEGRAESTLYLNR